MTSTTDTSPSPIAAQREAQARCRRDGGPLDTVTFENGETFVGSPYDALHVALGHRLNGLPVTLDRGGVEYVDDAVLGLRF